MAEPWIELLRTIDDVPTPGTLAPEVARRRASFEAQPATNGSSAAVSRERGRRVAGHARRVAALGALFGAVVGVLVLLAVAAHSRHNQVAGPTNDAWTAYSGAWSKLPSPPQPRTGAALAWTGTELVSLGGAVPGAGPATRDGYAFHPRTGSWSRIPPAPGPGRIDATAFWTGHEVLLVGGIGHAHQTTPVPVVALDPRTNTWSVAPSPPIPVPRDAVKVWTGHSLLVWGGGRRGAEANRSGAVYVPATKRWHVIRSAPIGLNAATGLWTGSQMIVLGALLDRDNHAATRTAIGAVYDPRADTWRRLAPSSLAPQATSAGLLGDRLVAWDYVGHSQQYSLASDRWSPVSETPFGFGECQPQTLTTQATMFAFFCGHAATVDPSADRWATLSGGVTAPTVKLGDRRVPRFQTASLTAVGGSVAIAATGLVLDKGTPCFGCQGAMVSYWLYRPHS